MIDIQTNDTKMKEILRLVDSVASSRSSVLVQGEPSTGKNSLAKLVHQKSNRNQSPCVIVNCAQQPEMLLETELFGFEKGAFAGTVSEKRGKFEQAHNGTIILDDVSELSLKLQAKLLRVLENATVERLGATTAIPVDVRVVSVTNKNLADLVSQGRFNEALYFRLNNVTITMPPVRERTADIKGLVSTMMGRISTRTGRRVSGITEEAVEKLSTHDFPNNLRELESILERAMMSANDGVIRALDITVGQINPATHQGSGAHSIDWETQAQWAPGRTLDEIERAVILKSLAYHNGNRTHTARELGISIRTLRNKLNEYRRVGIDV